MLLLLHLICGIGIYIKSQKYCHRVYSGSYNLTRHIRIKSNSLSMSTQTIETNSYKLFSYHSKGFVKTKSNIYFHKTFSIISSVYTANLPSHSMSCQIFRQKRLLFLSKDCKASIFMDLFYLILCFLKP